MPFTFSHPFIVLPLCASKKRIFSATGLIIGSMAMDFEYFIYMKKIEHESFHTIPGGVFIFGLPASILLAFIYHIIVRNKFIDNLPPVIQRRMAGFRELNWLSYFKTNYTTVIFSMLIGIYSHLFLDAFTHDFGFFVQRFAVLQQDVNIAGKSVPVYELLQAALSLAGAVIIAIAFFNLEPRTGITIKPIYTGYWLAMTTVFTIVMLLRFTLDVHHNKPIDMLIASIAGLLIAIVVVSSWPQKKVFIRQEL